MRAAATLLSSAESTQALLDRLRCPGISGEMAPLDNDARALLGLDAISDCQLALSRGTMRVLVGRLDGRAALRDVLQRAARTLSARAPNVLWLVAIADTSNRAAAIAGWTSDARGTPRISSFVWEPGRVVDSDAETLCALAGVGGDTDVLFHARCLEVLGRERLTRRFYRALRAEVEALAESLPRGAEVPDRRHVALLYTSRLLFLCFLEAKGWLNGERSFVASRFDECMRVGGRFHQRVLLPLFFGTLNTPFSRRAHAARMFGAVPFLNGGLFTRTAAERRMASARFPDERLGSMLQELFLRFRFVAREDSASWSEASVDPEMLGRAFESLMAASDRRTSGVYYTPHDLVARVA